MDEDSIWANAYQRFAGFPVQRNGAGIILIFNRHVDRPAFYDGRYILALQLQIVIN